MQLKVYLSSSTRYWNPPLWEVKGPEGATQGNPGYWEVPGPILYDESGNPYLTLDYGDYTPIPGNYWLRWRGDSLGLLFYKVWEGGFVVP